MTVPATSKPEIDFPGGDAPTELQLTDLVVGEGAEAVPGAKPRSTDEVGVVSASE